MSLYVENLDRYSDYLVSIVCGNKQSGIKDIQGILLEDSISLDQSANFQGSDLAMGSDAAKGAIKAVAEKYAGGVAGGLIDKKFNSVIQSAEDWQGGSPFSFSIKFNVFKTGKNSVGNCSSYQDFQANLAKLTQPKPGDHNAPQLSHY